MVPVKRKSLDGTVISSGVISGVVRVILPGRSDIPEIPIPVTKINNEIDSLDLAVEKTMDELRELSKSAGKKMSGPVAKIFDAQLLIAGDYEFLKKVKNEIVSGRRNAAFIYNRLVKETIVPLKSSSDSYMSQMARDIEAVAGRILAHLTGTNEQHTKFPPNTILVGKSFTPGEILKFRQRKAVGFVISEGGRNSHMALIARGLLLPVVLSKNAYLNLEDNDRIIVDGVKGAVLVNPTENDLSEYQKIRKKQGPANITRIKRLAEFPPKTSDGIEFNVGANLTLPGPADEVLSEHKVPVGLYRTEFLYLAHNDFPSEDDQTEFYTNIAELYRKSSVVLRTFDLGYDKLTSNGDWPVEDNPALGWRGIRAMLGNEEQFKTQIRAILKASAFGNVKIMLPMISDVTEVDRAKKLIQQVKFKLRKEKIKFDENIQIGIMIEVPSAAINAEYLAGKVDFMSIGTNDLTQYTLAVDRMNNKVSHLYSAYHPTVLRLIRYVVNGAKKKNIPVSICGEVAGDLLALPLFIGMGIDMLSMNPAKIFDLCRLVNKIDSSTAKHLSERVLECKTQQEVITNLKDFRNEIGRKKTIRRRK